MSEDRLARARHAVDMYAGAEAEGEAEPWIQDLITDLLHLVDEDGGDAIESMLIAAMHWREERGCLIYNVFNHVTEEDMWTSSRSDAERCALNWAGDKTTVSCYRKVDGEVDTSNPVFEGVMFFNTGGSFHE